MISDIPELIWLTGKTAYLASATCGIGYMYKEVLNEQLLVVLAKPINHHDKQMVSLEMERLLAM